MKHLTSLVAGVALAFAAAAPSLLAQNTPPAGGRTRGNSDPAEFRTRMLERLREQFEVKDDAEWKVLSDAIGKVLDARQELFSSQMRGMFGPRRPRPDVHVRPWLGPDRPNGAAELRDLVGESLIHALNAKALRIRCVFS